MSNSMKKWMYHKKLKTSISSTTVDDKWNKQREKEENYWGQMLLLCLCLSLVLSNFMLHILTHEKKQLWGRMQCRKDDLKYWNFQIATLQSWNKQNIKLCNCLSMRGNWSLSWEAAYICSATAAVRLSSFLYIPSSQGVRRRSGRIRPMSIR